MVADLCDRVVSITTDQGVEAKLEATPSELVTREFLPQLGSTSEVLEDLYGKQLGSVAPTLFADDDEEPDGEPDDDDEEPYVIPWLCGRLFPRALWVPGMLHMLHTAVQDLTIALSKFKDFFLPKLRHIVTLLSSRWMRERFVSQCLLGQARRAFGHLFDDMTISLAEWRWGSLMAALGQVLKVMEPLRMYFLAELMDFKDSAANDEERQQRPRECDPNDNFDSMALLGVVIADKAFWAYAHMLLKLGSIVEDFVHFAYSCRCCPKKGDSPSCTDPEYACSTVKHNGK